MSKKLALALGSGGSRGVCHVGVLKALEEEGIRPDMLCGSSMGSVVGACYASGMPPEDMLQKILKIGKHSLIDLKALPITRGSLLRGKKMQKLLRATIGDITFDELKIPFACVATDMLCGQTVTLNSGKVYTAVCASSSMPAIFPAVERDNMLLCDGGVLCRVPFQQALDMGADVVLSVDALANTKERVEGVNGLISVVMRVFDMMDNNQTEMAQKLTISPNEIRIAPEMKGLSQYEIKGFEQAYEEGYSSAKQVIPTLKQLLND